MERVVFGMPFGTAVIVTGVPVVISVLLAFWGVYYKPERYGNGDGNASEKREMGT